MLGYLAKVKKADFKLSGEVDAAVWVPLHEALGMLREGSIAWQLVKRAREEYYTTGLIDATLFLS